MFLDGLRPLLSVTGSFSKYLFNSDQLKNKWVTRWSIYTPDGLSGVWSFIFKFHLHCKNVSVPLRRMTNVYYKYFNEFLICWGRHHSLMVDFCSHSCLWNIIGVLLSIKLTEGNSIVLSIFAGFAGDWSSIFLFSCILITNLTMLLLQMSHSYQTGLESGLFSGRFPFRIFSVFRYWTLKV